MDKIINTKEKFYLLKKHMRKDDYESLIKDSNKSLLNILQIKNLMTIIKQLINI